MQQGTDWPKSSVFNPNGDFETDSFRSTAIRTTDHRFRFNRSAHSPLLPTTN